MPEIESLRILRQPEKLDRVSKSKTPLYLTKNGKAYLVVMSPESYIDMIKELEFYKKSWARERELHELSVRVEKSRRNVELGESLTEEELDQVMQQILA